MSKTSAKQNFCSQIYYNIIFLLPFSKHSNTSFRKLKTKNGHQTYPYLLKKLFIFFNDHTFLFLLLKPDFLHSLSLSFFHFILSCSFYYYFVFHTLFEQKPTWSFVVSTARSASTRLGTCSS